MPLSACSNRPRRAAAAPVKAPRSWPNNSDSNKSLGIAAVLMAINGFSARGLCLCSALATSSLPLPDSPLINTVACERLSRPMARKTSCMAGAWPIISGVSSRTTLSTAWRILSSTARLITSIAWSTSNGLAKYSNAPP